MPAHYKTVPNTTNYKYPAPRDEPNQYKEPIGPQRQTLREKIESKLRPAKEWMEAHPHNRKERPERTPRAAPGKRRVMRVDKYQDGKVTETVYFGTDEKTPRRQAPRKQPKPRGDPLGGLGSGMSMQDFIPSNMGLGNAMGYTEPRGKKRKKQSDDGWMDPSYIPPHLKQFF